MKITKKGWVFLAIIVLHLSVVVLIALITESTSTPRTMVRIMGLSALIVMFYAATITLFLQSIIKHFGKSFIKIHHAFAITGFILLATHGIIYATVLSTGLNLELWTIFSLSADLCAISAIIAAIKRKSWTKIWRYIHMLMYVMLFFVTLHGIFGGTDFTTPAILDIYISMLIALGISFILKRMQIVKSKKVGKSEKARWQCQVCGYLYDEGKEDLKFESLPSDWKCPVCRASKDQFEKTKN